MLRGSCTVRRAIIYLCNYENRDCIIKNPAKVFKQISRQDSCFRRIKKCRVKKMYMYKLILIKIYPISRVFSTLYNFRRRGMIHPGDDDRERAV